MSLTYLQLSLDPSFASFPKRHLRLVVLCHDLHKLPGQHCMLRTSGSTRTEGGHFRLQTFRIIHKVVLHKMLLIKVDHSLYLDMKFNIILKQKKCNCNLQTHLVIKR